MNTYCNINETMLSEVYGGNSGGAAVVAALGCAAALVKSAILQLKIFSRKLKKKPVLKPKLKDC